MQTRQYIGYVKGGSFERFTSPVTPTTESHGSRFVAVIGPFRTVRGAKWAEKYGYNNPHFQHVNDAERFARYNS